MTKVKKVLIVISAIVLILLSLISLPIVYVEYIVPNSTGTSVTPAVNPSVLKEADRQYLMDHGLHDPINDIVKDLEKHPELIPCKGTLGGTPGFEYPEEIIVHDREQVTATFSDGHYDGEIEFTFAVSEGLIMWKAVKWNCNGYDLKADK